MSYLKTFKLNELYELSSGISTTPEQSGHGYPFCSFSTIFNNPILPEELPDLMDTSEDERRIYSILEGDVLLTRTSETLDELAMTSVALKDYPNATYSGFAKRMRPISKEAYPKFMAFFFRSKYFRQIINNKAVMTLRASFNENIFNDISFQLPPLEDQIKAGDFLYDIELKIRNNNALAEDFKKTADILFDYWFLQYGQIDKSQLVFSEKLKDSIPLNWRVVKIIDLIAGDIGGDWGKEEQIGNYKQKVSCIRGTDIPSILDGVNCKLEDRFILDKNIGKCLQRGDYVIEVSGTPGRSTYINDNLIQRFDNPLIASNFCCAFSLKDTKTLYWFHMLWQRIYRKGVTKNYSGKTTIANLLFDSLADSVYVALPSDDILQKFNNIVEPMFENIQRMYAENESLNRLRNYLIDFFMTGQVKIQK